MSEITSYLAAIRAGVPGANETFLTAVYETLRRIAARRLSNEARNQPLHPTDLVHEAWIRLGGNDLVAFENHRHFFGAASEAMRRTLIDNARRRKRLKRTSVAYEQVSFCDYEVDGSSLAGELLDLNDSLEAFERIEPLKAQVVKLKFFGGMTISEIASVMNLSSASIERHWAYAKVWLYQRMNSEESKGNIPQEYPQPGS